jgi:biopolymer transport protein ExbB
MVPLAICSVIVLAVILERFFFWLKISLQRRQALVDEILELARRGDWEEIRRKTVGSKDYVIRVLISGILHRHFSMAKAMEAAANEEIKRMGQFMGIMDTMITVAPLLGIFGTVIGIIESFDVLGTTGIEEPAAVTSGIAQALITTASGLGIAIMTVFPYNYYNSRIESAARIIEGYATSLEIVYEKQNSNNQKNERDRNASPLADNPQSSH